MISRARVSTLLLFAILVIAAVFRLWKLESIPPGLYVDEGWIGNQASQSMRDLEWRVYYPEVFGNEGLYPNLQSFVIKAFDLTGMEREAWMLRLTSAVIGILTVWGVYLLGKELFSRSKSAASPSLIPPLSNAELLGLSAAFFLATAFWHVNLSRIAFSTITVPFLVTFAVLFLFRAIRTWKISDFAIAGLFFGLAPYGYPSARFALLFGWLPLSFGALAHFKAYLPKPRDLLPLAAFAGIAVLAVLPLLDVFLNDPGVLTERARMAGLVFDAEEPLAAFWDSVRIHLRMFHFEGDFHNWRHNIPGEPMLLQAVGVVFLLGFFFLITELVGHLVRRRFWEALPLATLLLWLPVMLLPGALTTGPTPAALRSVGVLPAVAIVSALGVVRPLEILRSRFHIRPGLMIVLLLLFFLPLGARQFDKYFNDWAGNDAQLYEPFRQDLEDLGKYLRGFDDNDDIYLVVNGGHQAWMVPAFLTEGSRDIIIITHPNDLQSIDAREGHRLVVAFMQRDVSSEMKSLRVRFPAMMFRTQPFPTAILSAR